MEYAPFNLGRGFTKGERFLKRKREVNYCGAICLALMAGVVATVLLVLVSWFVDSLVVPKHAEAKQYPMTNKEVCQQLKEEGGWLQEGHMTDIIKLCAEYNIKL